MRGMGLMAIYPCPNLSKRDLQHHTYPFIYFGDCRITHPDQVWSVDITYIRMKQGWMYLYAVMDWYSRFIVDLATLSKPRNRLCVRNDEASSSNT
jgi:putative transposase